MRQMDGAGQLHCVQRVEESMGDWVSGEEASVHYPRTELSGTASNWTPALRESGCRIMGDIQGLAAVG